MCVLVLDFSDSDSADAPKAFISVLAALLITMIAIAVQHPGHGVKATVDNPFYKAFLAVTNIVFAYGMRLNPP